MHTSSYAYGCIRDLLSVLHYKSRISVSLGGKEARSIPPNSMLNVEMQTIMTPKSKATPRKILYHLVIITWLAVCSLVTITFPRS